ncbi:MAG: 4Fe-4S dicluster domain-containing protein [Candidatus Hodarchaeales archaeon]|jgi:Fe-S oxidoreductase
MELKTIEDLNLCFSIRCNYCSTACPVYNNCTLEFNSPRGKKELIFEMLEGNTNINPTEVSKIVYNCYSCRKCISSCPYEINTPRILWESRHLFKDSRSLRKYLFFLLYNIRSKFI